MSVRKLQSRRGWAVAFAASVIKPTLLAATSRTWIDGTRIPAEGGCIVVANHISHVDPLLTAHFVYDHGRIPRYLAKSEPVPHPLRRHRADAPPSRSRSSA